MKNSFTFLVRLTKTGCSREQYLLNTVSKELLLCALYGPNQKHFMFSVNQKNLGTVLEKVASFQQLSVPAPSISATKGCLNQSWTNFFSFDKNLQFFKRIPLTALGFLGTQKGQARSQQFLFLMKLVLLYQLTLLYSHFSLSIPSRLDSKGIFFTKKHKRYMCNIKHWRVICLKYTLFSKCRLSKILIIIIFGFTCKMHHIICLFY